VAQGKWFAERGYVMIQADVRGKFDSGGDFYPFKNEPDDGFDTDEWIAKQPWFDGKLGRWAGRTSASRSGARRFAAAST
jgi:predicted acyl esterase